MALGATSKKVALGSPYYSALIRLFLKAWMQGKLFPDPFLLKSKRRPMQRKRNKTKRWQKKDSQGKGNRKSSRGRGAEIKHMPSFKHPFTPLASSSQ
jgi:hypothetical protein